MARRFRIASRNDPNWAYLDRRGRFSSSPKSATGGQKYTITTTNASIDPYSNPFEDQYETLVLDQQQYNHFGPQQQHQQQQHQQQQQQYYLNVRRAGGGVHHMYGANNSPPIATSSNSISSSSPTSSSSSSSGSSNNSSPITNGGCPITQHHGVNTTSNTNSQITITTRINNGKLESEV